MRITKKALSIVLAIAMLITAVPMSLTGFAADVNVGTETTPVNTAQSDTLIRPSGTLNVTPVTRVCAATSTPFQGTTGTGYTVAATPSGIAKNSYTYGAAAYAGETPTPTTIVFTPGVAIDESSLNVTCNNESIQFVNFTSSNGTYSVQVADGCSATVGETLVFTVSYKYVYTDSQTGKTYNSDKVFKTTGFSYVESVLEPAGVYSYRKTHENWVFGTTTKNRSYISTFILGESTYSESTTTGSANFNGEGTTGEYGTMLIADGDDGGNSKNYNVAYETDGNRPITHVYMDKGANSTLADLNLRVQSYVAGQSDEDDEITTNTIAGVYEYSGNVKTYKGQLESGREQGDSNSSALNLQKSSGSSRNVGSFITMGFAGSGPAQASASADSTATYTVIVDMNTAAQWSAVYLRHSHTIKVTVFNKTKVRTNIQTAMNTEVTNMLIDPNTTSKGYNPQEWYYTAGWQAYEQAYNHAQSIYVKPNTTQSDIDSAAVSLQSAYNNLVLAEADYTNLDYWVGRANALDSSLYTPASWAAVEAAVAQYQDNINILYQPKVDQMALDIEKAINNLKYADADYSKVNEKVAEVNAIINDVKDSYNMEPSEFYSNWANLVSVVESAGYTIDEAEGEYVLTNILTKDKQSTVDTYPTAIATAIGALKKNSADFTEANAAMAEYSEFKSANASYLDTSYLSSLDNAYTTVYNLQLQAVTIERQADVDAATDTLNNLLDYPVYKAASYVAADKAIARADALVRENYEDMSAVDKAYNELVALYGLDARRQSEVDAAVNALNKAIDNLSENKADYSAVENAKAAAEAKAAEARAFGFEPSVYYSNWSAVQTALDAVVYGLPFTQQTKINGFASDINLAVKNLKVATADYSRLNRLEAEAMAILENESIYTSDSVNNLYDAIFAITSYTLPVTQQATVDAWADDIDAAIKAMAYVPADYSVVEVAISAANAKFAESKAFADAHNGVPYYSAETLAAVQNAIDAVVYGLGKDKQATVDNYATAINNAVALLAYGPADYTPVEEAKKAVPSDLSIYTDLSVATLNAALNYTTTYKTNRQSRVDEAAAKITAAIEGLQVKSLNTSAYDAIVIPSDTSMYTTASVKAVTDADAAVKAFLEVDRNYTHQAEFDALVATLKAAIKNLAYKPIDTAEYEAVKATIPADTSIYTPESVKAVTDAKAAVDTFLSGNVNITNQASLDVLVDALDAAIKALEVKAAPIDTTEYEAVKATIPADTSIYTSESVKAVTDANAAIEAFLAGDVDSTNQAELDALVDVLDAAIKNLALNAYFQANAETNCKIADGLITGLQTRLTLKLLQDTYLDYAGVTVTATNPTGGRFLGTGSVVTVTYPTGEVETYTIVIYGDMNGDGNVNTTDVTNLSLHISKSTAITAAQRKAMNLDGSRRVDTTDLSKLKLAIKNNTAINQANPAL